MISALALPPLLAGAVALAAPSGGPIPHAGEDLRADLGTPVQLSGFIEGHAPLDFWMGDGNAETENELIRYHSVDGLSTIGPLHRVNGKTMGWPGDLVRIDERVYGIDVGARLVYILDEDTGICLPVTSELPREWRGIHSLAHDAENDRLFAVDLNTGQLLRIERGSGKVTPIHAPGLRGKKGVRSLAFDPELRLLFAADYESDRLLVIEPKSGRIADTMILPRDPNSRIEELQFFEGELYAMTGLLERGELVGARLQRINLRTGFVSNVGPRLRNVSPHALLVNSVPEDFHWVQVGGPAVAEIEYTRALDTAVSFPQAGRYEFELRVEQVADRVVVEVRAAAPSGTGAPGSHAPDAPEGAVAWSVEPWEGGARVSFLVDPPRSTYELPAEPCLMLPRGPAGTPFVARGRFAASELDAALGTALRRGEVPARVDAALMGTVHEVLSWRRGAPDPCREAEIGTGSLVASSG